MSGVPLLVTGFEAFGGWPSNPTAELAPAVAEALGLPWIVLPVDLVEAPRALEAACARWSPAFTLHLGLSGRATAVQLERRAVNVAEFRIPDAAGRQPRGAALVTAAPPSLETRADLDALAAASGAALSESAGTYLCNALYFHALLRSGGNSLFVHVPPTPGLRAVGEGTEHGGGGSPGLPMAALRTAVAAIARGLLAGAVA